VSDPVRIGVIGSQISVCDSRSALDRLDERLRQGGGGYVCFTNAHAAVTGRQDARLRDVTNNSLLSVADGKSVYWLGRLKGARGIGHVAGPDFMPLALARFAERRHFFYGSTPEVLTALVAALRKRIPDLNICGTLSPPFRSLTPDETADIYRQIKQSGAEFVWVGLGAPKQEFWMADAWQFLQPAILLGVGAAFDFHAGTLRRAPHTWRLVGTEWLYRLLQEPQRLWKRYLVTNSLFIYYSFRDALIGERDKPA
jgi:N-acetylglucosaminyldiphosphoundecaprenol N-acetyl-beta-D-mannosaminyltransferase